jgi:N utilization substance protein A
MVCVRFACEPFLLGGQIFMEKDTDLKLLQVIQAIAHEKKISFDEVARNLTEALKLTYEKYFPETIIDFQFDIDKNFAALYEVYDVIDDNIEEYDDYIQKPLKEAKTIDPNAKIGSKVKLLMKFKDFEPSFIKDMGKNFRIGNAVIFNKNIYEIYKNKKGQIINCTVESSAKNIVLVKLDSDGLLGEVTDRNLIPTEILRPGQMYDFYVVDVIEQSKG